MNSKAIQVQQTKNYDQFKTLTGNRKLNASHLLRLRKSIEESYLFTVITVNEKFQIIDGQHRFHCLKDLKLHIYYIVCHGYGLPEVQKLNATSSTWKADDYMDGYCELKYSDYLQYREFKNKYGLDHNSCLLLLNGNTGKQGIKGFYDGEFKIVDIDKANEYANKLSSIAPLYEGYKRRSFVFAIVGLLSKPQFSFAEFLQKLSLNPSALIDCVTTRDYISIIEKIYNYRRGEKVNLRYI